MLQNTAGIWCRLVMALAIVFQTSTLFSRDFKEQKIVISGRVRGLDKTKDPNTISFIIRSLVAQTEKKVSTIGADGSFHFETNLAVPQEIIMHYQSFAHLVLRPGDYLKLEISNHSTGDPARANITENEFFTIKGGNLIRENEAILEFIRDIEKTIDYQKEQNTVKGKAPEEYKQYILERLVQQQAKLKLFMRDKKTSALFNRWAADYLQYTAWNNLLRYCWENPMLNSVKKGSLRLPAKYFSFLSSYNMDDQYIFSAPHVDFLYELYGHINKNLEHNKESLFAHLTKEKNITAMMKLYVDNLLQQTTGFTRNVFLTRVFTDALDGNQLNEFKATWHEEYITNSYFRKMVVAKSIDLYKYLQNQQIAKGSELLSINHKIVKRLIDTLSKQYSGKVIYIDFWAPWCSPCMAAMPASKEIQEYYKGKEIIFLFLANRCTDESWRATIANQGLAGVHINLSDDQFNVLAEKFKMTGIPHYVIINKKGIIFNANAPGPDKGKLLIEELNKLVL